MRMTYLDLMMFAVFVALIGCSGRELPNPTSTVTATLESLDGYDSVSTIPCRVELIAFDPDYFWTEDSETGHSQLRAPRARFKILEPAKYAGSFVAVIFSHQPHSANSELLDSSCIGKYYALGLPNAMFIEDFRSIGNLDVVGPIQVKK